MRSAIYSLLFLSFAAGAVAGCTSEAAPPPDLQAAQQPLQSKGVYYLQASGTAKNATFTFYDQNKAVIGDGQSSQTPDDTIIRWQGDTWEGGDSPFTKNGAAVDSKGADAVERDAAVTVFELGLDQAFPPAPATIHPNGCVLGTLCKRPNNRCSGGCTGFVCSSTDPHVWGECLPP